MYFGSTNGGLQVTSDDGKTWSQVVAIGSQIAAGMAIDGNFNYNYYVANGLGGGSVAISQDYGQTWSSIATTGQPYAGNVSTSVSASNGYIYVGTDGSGLSVSYYYLPSWSSKTTTNGLVSNRISTVFTLRTNVYVGHIDDPRLSVSNDNGQTWRKIDVGAQGNIVSLYGLNCTAITTTPPPTSGTI